MKKSISIITIAILLIALSGCGNKEQNKINVYFKSKTENVLVAEERSVDKAKSSTHELAEFAIECLLKGPTDMEKQAVMPANVALLSLTVESGVANVNFSQEYYGASGVDELLCRFAVVKTLCEIDEIKKVQILVNSQQLISQSTQTVVGALGESDIVTDSITASNERTTVKLYFPDETAEFLEPEIRKVELQGTAAPEKVVLTELLKGPGDKTLSSVIPAETKLLSVEVSDSVCFVNFSQDFVTKKPAGSTGEMMAIYSVVNSLTELDNIDSVQFLIEGKKGIEYGNFVFDEPLMRKEDIIKK